MAADEHTPGPAKVVVLASVLVPGDAAMPLETLEAYIARW